MKNWNPLEKCMFWLIMSAVALSIVVPLLFFTSIAFANNQENSDFPKKLLPSFSVTIKVEHLETGSFKIFLKKDADIYMPTITSSNSIMIESYFLEQFSIRKPGKELLEDFSSIPIGESQEFKYSKDLTYNFEMFFAITSNADKALFNSIKVVFLTILISLTFGSMSGYAIARYTFKFKDSINILLLVVRMFPAVGISIPLAVILIKMNLFDTMLGLAILYSLPNIALTSWITSSIFVGINKELEEASLVFGANGFQTFMHITLPMALPALAASSLYAFLTAWNDTLSALILTDKNATLSLAVYKAIGDNMSSIQYTAAGSVLLILPALVFVLVVRKYVNQMWGGLSI